MLLGFDAIVCVAGGWAGGSAAADDFLASLDRMWKYNAQSAASTAHVAAKTLKEVRRLQHSHLILNLAERSACPYWRRRGS